MENLFWIGIGAAGVIGLIILRLAAKHGWAWVRDELKAHADQAEADFKAKVSAAAGDIESRVTAIENQLKVKFQGDIDKLKEDVAALKGRALVAIGSGGSGGAAGAS
jgi:hypothetical protein